MKKIKEQVNKLPRREGITYLRCQHLKEKTQTHEQFSLWIGETLRLICCPVCHKMHLGGTIRTLKMMDISNMRYPPEVVNDWFGLGDVTSAFWEIDTSKKHLTNERMNDVKKENN